MKLKLAFISALILVSCSSPKSDIELVQSAKEFQAVGDHVSAIIELKSAIQQNSDNNEARYLLASSYLAIQNGASAEKELNKAINSGMSQLDLMDELALAHYYQGKFDDVLASTTEFQQTLGAARMQVLLYRALSQLQLTQTQEAKETLTLCANAETDPIASTCNAYLRYLDSDLDGSFAALNTILTEENSLAEAHILAANIYLKKGKPQAAAAEYRKALALEGQRLDLHVEAAKVFAQSGELEEAHRLTDRVLRAAPKHWPSMITKASLALLEKDWESAKEFAEKALLLNENNVQAKLFSGIANFYLEQWEMARNRLLAAMPYLPKSHIARKMHAYCEFKLGDVESGIVAIREASSGSAEDVSILNKLSSELIAAGRLSEATTLLQDSIELDPSNAASLATLGVLKLSQNDPSGIEALQSISQDDSLSGPARNILIRHHIEKGEFKEAHHLAKEAVSDGTFGALAYLLTAEVFNAESRFEEAKQELQTGLAQAPENLNLLHALHKVYYRKRNFENAETTLQKMLAISPQHRVALLDLYRTAKASGDVSGAMQQIRSVAMASNAPDDLKLMFALILSDEKQKDEAVNVLTAISGASDFHANALYILSTIEARRGDLKAALTHNEALIAATPNNLKARHNLVGILVALGRDKQALKAARDAREQFPEDSLLHLSEIELSIKNDQVATAERELDLYTKRYGDTKEANVVRAQLYSALDQYDEALAIFEDMHDANPNSTSVVLLAQAMDRISPASEGTRLLSRWVEQYPQDDKVKKELKKREAWLEAQNKVALLRQIIEKNPDNHAALNNLAYALTGSGDFEEAISYAERAYNLAPDLAPILDTYGYLLLLTGNLEKAKPLLRQAHEKQPAAPDIAYHYAIALIQSNQTSKARGLLSEAVKSDFKYKQEALAALASLN